MSAVWASVIAVLGTLIGGLLPSLQQARTARVARQEARCDARQVDALAAVTALVTALADHRRAMWKLKDRKLTGADEQVVADLETASHETRSVVTGPLVRVRILTPALAQMALAATQASFAMRGATDPDDLEQRRQHAADTSDRLVAAASDLFAGMGVLAHLAPRKTAPSRSHTAVIPWRPRARHETGGNS